MEPLPAILQTYREALYGYACEHDYTLEENPIQYGLRFKIGIKGLARTVLTVYQTGKVVIPQKCPELPGLNELLTTLAARSAIHEFGPEVWRFKDQESCAKARQVLLKLSGSITRESKAEEEVYGISDGAEKLVVKVHSSGTLTMAGKGSIKAAELLRLIETELGATRVGQQAASSRAPKVLFPYIGTDESGKGDYFGPLVVAGVLVDSKTAAALQALKVRDSKTIGAKEIKTLAVKIKELCQDAYRVIVVAPESYNQLYEQFRAEGKSLNSLLAWAHARILEDLASAHACSTAITDKFGDESLIRSRLARRKLQLDLLQIVRAERYIGVAAASILARDQFVTYLEEKSQAAGFALPLGVNDRVIAVAKTIFTRWGFQGLRRIAKLHFKTTNLVVGAHDSAKQ